MTRPGPKLGPGGRRDHAVMVRLNDDERATIEAAADPDEPLAVTVRRLALARATSADIDADARLREVWVAILDALGRPPG